MLNLEVHLSHQCNFRCNSCSHYSQYHHTGHLSLTDARFWYQLWSHRLTPTFFSLLGGEPTLNPHFVEHVELAAYYWSKSTIRIVTNGIFLKNHPGLAEVLSKCKDYTLQISLHSNDDKYLEKIGEITSILKTQNIRYTLINSYQRWTQRYTEQDSSITPFDDKNPRKSWEICPAKECVQLYHGKLWKCPAIAYLSLMDKKKLLSEAWDQYLTYKPLKYDCKDEELQSFLEKGDEYICGMCPSEKIMIANFDHHSR